MRASRLTSWIGVARALTVRALAVAGSALALAGCAGPPLPADPHALEAELRARVDVLRAAFATFQAEGTVAIEGPDHVKLNWRADAVRGQWARVAVSSSLATDPVVEVRAGAGDGLLVRVSPPGAPPALYRAPEDLSDSPVDGPLRAAAEWLIQLAREDRSAMPSLSRIGPSGPSHEVVRVEITRKASPRATSQNAVAVALRRSDGLPLAIEAALPDDPAPICLLARPRANRLLAVTGAPLSLAAEVEASFRACCSRKPLASARVRIVRVRNDRPDPLPPWSGTARPIEALRDDRWMRRTFQSAEAVRDAALRECSASADR
jgi:hypothetical protein